MTSPLSDGQIHIWRIPITGQNLDLFPGNREVPAGHYSSFWENLFPQSRAADVLLVLKFIWSLFLLFWLWSKESITFYHSCWTSDTGGRFCVVLMMMVVLHCYNAIKSPLQRSYYITSESTGAPTFDFLTSLRFLRWTETTMDNPQTIQTISCCSLWLITCYQYVGEHDVTACLG